MPISSTTAETIYGLARILILLATIFGVTGTIGLFWAGSARDRDLAEQHQEEVVDAQKMAAKWESQATLAQRELERLKAAALSSEAGYVAGTYKVLTQDQIAAAVTRLKYLSKAPVRISYPADGGDAANFGGVLEKLLVDAGFTVTRVTMGERSNGPGVTLVVGRSDTPPDGAMEVLGVLTALGVPCHGVAANTDEMKDIFIEVAPPKSAG